MSAPIVWEDRTLGFFERLTQTIWRATRDPIGTFAALGTARVGEPDLASGTAFALIATAIGYSPYVVLAPCLGIVPLFFAQWMPPSFRGLGTGLACGLIGALPFLLVVGSLFVELVHGLVFHAICAALGGRGSFRASLHAMLYTSAVRAWLLPILVVGMVPGIGVALQSATRLAFVVWAGFACYGAARGVHGLGEDRAPLAGLFVAILSAAIPMLITSAVVGAVLFAIFGSLTFPELWRQMHS
ncbi:MAG: hypothetical protein U0234_10945 [Sandaracinus sp.]